jgi:GTP-dependent phosphoenolpyruvate carboxykinase
MSQQNFEKLIALDNEKLFSFVADAIELTNPASVFVCTDKPEDTKELLEEF